MTFKFYALKINVENITSRHDKYLFLLGLDMAFVQFEMTGLKYNSITFLACHTSPPLPGDFLLYTLFRAQAPVVRRLDNAIHRINRFPVDNCQQTNHAIHWIVIYPMDSVVDLSNNPGRFSTLGIISFNLDSMYSTFVPVFDRAITFLELTEPLYTIVYIPGI